MIKHLWTYYYQFSKLHSLHGIFIPNSKSMFLWQFFDSWYYLSKKITHIPIWPDSYVRKTCLHSVRMTWDVTFMLQSPLLTDIAMLIWIKIWAPWCSHMWVTGLGIQFRLEDKKYQLPHLQRICDLVWKVLSKSRHIDENSKYWKTH